MFNITKKLALVLLFSALLSACFRASPRDNDPIRNDAAAGLIDVNEFYCQLMNVERGGVPVEVHRLDDDRCYPVGIFANPTAPDRCEYDHFHYTLISLDGTYRTDERHPDCGAATVNDIEGTGTYYITHAQAVEWNELWRQQGITPVSIDFTEETSDHIEEASAE